MALKQIPVEQMVIVMIQSRAKLPNLKYFGIFRLISVFETTAMLKFANLQ